MLFMLYFVLYRDYYNNGESLFILFSVFTKIVLRWLPAVMTGRFRPYLRQIIENKANAMLLVVATL